MVNLVANELDLSECDYLTGNTVIYDITLTEGTSIYRHSEGRSSTIPMSRLKITYLYTNNRISQFYTIIVEVDRKLTIMDMSTHVYYKPMRRAACNLMDKLLIQWEDFLGEPLPDSMYKAVNDNRDNMDFYDFAYVPLHAMII